MCVCGGIDLNIVASFEGGVEINFSLEKEGGGGRGHNLI